jgi:hypothetical protein
VLKLGRKKYALTTVLDVFPLAALDAVAPSLPFQPKSDAAFHSFVMVRQLAFANFRCRAHFFKLMMRFSACWATVPKNFAFKIFLIRQITNLKRLSLIKVHAGKKQTYKPYQEISSQRQA